MFKTVVLVVPDTGSILTVCSRYFSPKCNVKFMLQAASTYSFNFVARDVARCNWLGTFIISSFASLGSGIPFSRQNEHLILTVLFRHSGKMIC